MARSCLFCGGQPVTGEHLWPDWLRREVQVDTPFPHTFVEEVDGDQTRDLHFAHPPFDQQVRAVCAACNNGWMSQLEATAKPLIKPLLEYRGRHLHRRQQREVATWALMKAAVFDATHPKRPAVLAAHREHLFAKAEPPPENLWIWLATCDAEQVSTYAYQGIKLTPPGATQAPDEATAYIVTFTIGPLVVQLAGSALDDLSFDDIVFPQLDVARIWPSSGGVTYRQRNLMTARTLHAFTTALYDDLIARSSPTGPAAV